MKKLFMILPLALILCLTVSSQVKEAENSSEDLEKELRATVKSYYHAWNGRDLDTYFEISADAIGFGRWTAPPRDKMPKKTQVNVSEYFLKIMEISEYVMEEEPIVYVVGDTGLVLGKIIEKAKPKNGELKSYDVRYSLTFIRSEGKWKLVLYHRDVQFSK
jgi:ketosteroid isomerase-like protein